MTHAEIWAAVPEKAKEKYFKMCQRHSRMCLCGYEPSEARALRKDLTMYYRFQCEAAEKKLRGGDLHR